MKTLVRHSLLIVAFIAYSTLLLFHLSQGFNQKPVFQSQTLSKASFGLPVRLRIPVINVNASIQQVGITSKGEMEVPSNSVDVGWFKLGSRPGEKGSAVIAGHFDGNNGEAGVFTDLDKLKEGDKVYIEDDNGVSIAFVVQKSAIYDPGYADNVFNQNDNISLNLITCDGTWDGFKKSYTKRLVVFTEQN